jgi:hypothetical protein
VIPISLLVLGRKQGPRFCQDRQEILPELEKTKTRGAGTFYAQRERYAPTRVGFPIGTNFEALPISRFAIETSRYFGEQEAEFARVRFKWNRER